MYCLKFSSADRLPSSSIGRASGSGPGGWWFESTLGNRSHLFVPAGPPAPWGFFVSCRGAPTKRSPAVPEREKEASRRGHAETNPRGCPGHGRAGEGEQRGHAPGPEEQIRSGPSSLPDGRQNRRPARKIQA